MPTTQGLTAEQVKLIGDLLVPRMVQELRGEFQRLRDDFTEALAQQEGRTHQRFGAVETRLAALESPENRRLAELDRRLRAVERLHRNAMLGYGVLVALATWGYQIGKDALWRLMAKH